MFLQFTDFSVDFFSHILILSAFLFSCFCLSYAIVFQYECILECVVFCQLNHVNAKHWYMYNNAVKKTITEITKIFSTYKICATKFKEKTSFPCSPYDKSLKSAGVEFTFLSCHFKGKNTSDCFT